MTLSILTVNAYASGFTDIVLTQEEVDKDSYGAIENALTTAKNNASEENVYRIFVPSGTYTLMSGLHIYSNTQLYLNADTVLNRGFESGNMIKAGLRGELTKEYSGYKNIVISGGVWDSGYIGKETKPGEIIGSCAMRFAHCTNLTISNVTIKNIVNAHHLEIAAVDGFYLDNCAFSGMKRTNESSAEAVQIDILHDYEHFPDYYYYDDTPCKNVYVRNCTFTDLFAGVGTRSGVIGSYFDNINITGNTFNNISDKAISCFNYINSKINNNTINNATVGVVFEYLPPTDNISERFSRPYSGVIGDVIQKGQLKADCSSEINSNVINVNKLYNAFTCSAIYAYAGEIDSVESKDSGIPIGDYKIKNLTISGNSISAYHPQARGIYLTGVRESDITNNVINDASSADDGINGINLCASSANTVVGNTFSGSFNNAISLYGNNDGNSRANNIDANVINSVKSYGVRIANGSTASIKSSNAFNYCGISPLCIVSESYSQNLPGVTIKQIRKSPDGRAFIEWNGVSGASGYKLYRSFSPYSGYRQIATVKNGKTVYADKSARPGMTCYYKISPYKEVSSSAVISASGAEKGITL